MCKKYSISNRLKSFSLFEAILALLVLSFVTWMVFEYNKESQRVIASVPKQEVLLRADMVLKQVALEYMQTQRLNMPSQEVWGTYEIVWQAMLISGNLYRLEALIKQNQEISSSLVMYVTFS